MSQVISRDSFWTNVLSAWTEINFTAEVEHPQSQIIWLNSKICVNNAPIFWNDCWEKGLKSVKQLFTDQRTISWEHAYNEFALDTMHMNSLISAIPKEWQKICKKATTVTPTECLYDTLVNQKNVTSASYTLLISDNQVMRNKCQAWELDLQIQLTLQELLKSFKHIYLVTNVTKFRSFQYRLLQQSIITNTHLYKWGLKQSELCSFCTKERETILHLLVYCEETAKLWIQMERFMDNYSKDQINFSTETVIFNRLMDNPIHIKNTICLIIKQFIYKQWCLNESLNVKKCKQYIRNVENSEKYYATKNNNMHKHQKKWKPDTKPEIIRNAITAKSSNFIEQYIYEM